MPALGRRVFLALLAALASGAIAGILLLGSTRLGPGAGATGPLTDAGWTSRSRAWFTVRGLYAAELHEDGHHYTWTSPAVRLVIPHLDRTRPHRLTLTLSARRPPGIELPSLAWSVDGTARGPVAIGNDFSTIDIDLPPREADRAVITLQIDRPWDPGPDDDRQLGVFVRDVALTTPDRSILPLWSVVGTVALSVVLLTFPIWLAGLPMSLTVGAAALVAAATSWMTSLDGAFLGPFPEALLAITAVTSALSTVAVITLVLVRKPESVWPGVAALVLGATAVKLVLFAHPLAIIGDGIFQVHRAQLVAAGQYYFTSITPRPFFEFPYAIALYVAAMPFWSWVPREIDRVWLLRVVSLAADAVAGLALAAVVWRAWASRGATLFVAALWPFARAPFEALSNANLTNAFGQSVFTVALAGLAWSASGGAFAWPVAVAAGAALTVAFLSHFSTISVGIPLVGLVACSLLLGRSGDRLKAVRVVVLLLSAIAVSYAVYYRHFGEVYQKTIERVMTEQPVDTTRSSIAASPWVKLKRWATAGSDDYGLPGLVLGLAAAAGAVLLARRRTRDTWTLVLAGWLATWIGFTALGILTSVQMRVNLAAAPVFVCLGAYALDRLAARGRTSNAAAVLLALAIVWNGIRLWRICLGA